MRNSKDTLLSNSYPGKMYRVLKRGQSQYVEGKQVFLSLAFSS